MSQCKQAVDMLKTVSSLRNAFLSTPLPVKKNWEGSWRPTTEVGLEQGGWRVLSFFCSFLQAVGNKSRSLESQWGFGEPVHFQRWRNFLCAPYSLFCLFSDLRRFKGWGWDQSVHPRKTEGPTTVIQLCWDFRDERDSKVYSSVETDSQLMALPTCGHKNGWWCHGI